MDYTGKKLQFAIQAVVLSLLLHGLLFLILDNAQLSPRPPAVKPEKPLKTMRIQTIDIRDVVFPREAGPVDKSEARDLRFTDPHQKNVPSLLAKLQAAPAKPPPEVRLVGPGKAVAAPRQDPGPPPSVASVPPPKIVEIDAQQLAPDRLSPGRERTAKVTRQELIGDRVPGFVTSKGGPGGGGGSGGELIDVSMRLGKMSGAPLRPDELAELEKKYLTDLPAGPGVIPAPSLISPGGDETAGRLEGLVTVTLTVYEPGTGGGFFRVDIAPNPNSRQLRTISKDILFLVDCSTSITPTKLAQFKEGISRSLPLLRPEDRVNVVAFRDTSTALFKEPAPVTPETTAAAQRFIDDQERGGLTDVYRSVSGYVRAETPPPAYRPFNVFLLSDGQSTVNDRLDNDAFIREVAKLRQNHVSIHSFSAGSNANRFLLDLLAYSNRGASLHEEAVPKFAPNLVEFIRTHSELIVADLRYRATGELAKESYPKQLPHLYRGKTLSIYGRYDEGVDTVGMQLIGRDADGKDQELVFRGNLKTAPRTGPQLAVDWASQKVFFLLVERVMTPSPEATAEIRKLAQRYHLIVPYM